jgi:hypothetical protein
MLTREYRDGEEVRLGDVVQLFEGAYGAAVVTKVGDEVVCERVHASASLLGQIEIGVERVTFSAERARELPVFVRGPGGEADNRHRG